MPICFNCNTVFDTDLENCPLCHSKYNQTKENFIKYIGEPNNLIGYQNSYKLVLLKFIIESMNNYQALVSEVISKIRMFYMNRYVHGLPTDYNVDDRIKNIQSYDDYDVYAVIKNQPYKVINDKGFIFINKGFNGKFVFTFNEDIINSMSKEEFTKLKNLIDKKLDYYYSSKASNPVLTTNKNSQTIQKESLELDADISCASSFSSNLKNALKRKGITTIDELIEFDSKTGHEMIHIFGSKQYNQICNLIININKSRSDYNVYNSLIRHHYSDNCWSGFLRFCRERNIIYIKDLSNFEFEQLLSIKGFGTEKVNKIQSKYLSIINNNAPDSSFSIIGNSDLESQLKIHSSNFNLTIENISIIGISNKTIKQFAENGIKTIGQLDGKSKSYLFKVLGSYKLEDVYEKLYKFSNPLIEVVSDILGKLKNNRDFDFYIKRAEGFSLQEIADNNSCTRERVRQIENKMFKRIKNLILLLIYNYFEENSIDYIDENIVLNFFNDDDFDKIIIYTLKNCNELEYLSFANLFIKKRNDNQNTTQALFKYAKDFIGDGINLYEKLDNLDELLDNAGYSYISADAFLNLLIECNAYFYGDYVTLGKKSYSFLCAKIVEEHFKNGILLYSEQDIQRLRELTVKNFGKIKMPENNRALSTALAKKLVICDRGKAISPKNINFDINSLETIKDYIDTCPLNKIYYSEIYSEYEGLLSITTDINNYNFLHGVLQYCYPNDYNYSRDFLEKKNDEGIKLNIESRINNILVEAGHALNKQEISTKLGGYSDTMIFNAVYNSKILIQWDYNCYNSINNIKYTQNDKDILLDLLSKIMNSNRGYCSDGMIYQEVDTNHSNFLTKNNINNKTNLFYVLDNLFSCFFVFKRPHICKPNIVKNLDTKNIVLYLLDYPEIINFNDYNSLSKKLCWSSVTSGLIFSILEDNSIRLSQNNYLKKELFSIDKSALNKLSEELSSLVDEIGIIPLIGFDEFEKFPNIDYEWNVFLLGSIIENFDIGYKLIKPATTDRRFQKAIIVKRDFAYKNYIDIVLAKLKKSSLEIITENEMLSFLLINHLAIKTIPKELYNSPKLTFEEGNFYTKNTEAAI